MRRANLDSSHFLFNAMNLPLVSVVIPTYNHSVLLERCLRSLADQTLAPQLEVIVVNDGSTDGTKELLQRVEFGHIIRLATQHEGTPHARNVGIAKARSELVAFIDDDVTCRPDCFERAYAHFEDPGVGVVQTNLLTEENDRPLLRKAASQGFITAAIFFRKKALVEVGGMDEEFFDKETEMFFRDDTDLGLRVVGAGYTAVQAEDAVAWHPVLFPDLAACFRHVKRYMFDPLLYRKHRDAFRRGMERKKLGSLAFGRPLHYAALVYKGSTFLMIVAALLGWWWLVGSFAVSFLLGYLTIRFKYQGWRALHVWKIKDTFAFFALPWVYLYWFFRGCVKFRSWGAIL
jgi:glycosyltransferase involved in cell wall biosynthesis